MNGAARRPVAYRRFKSLMHPKLPAILTYDAPALSSQHQDRPFVPMFNPPSYSRFVQNAAPSPLGKRHSMGHAPSDDMMYPPIISSSLAGTPRTPWLSASLTDLTSQGARFQPHPPASVHSIPSAPADLLEADINAVCAYSCTQA